MVEKISSSLIQNNAALLQSTGMGSQNDSQSGGLSELLKGLNLDQLNLSKDAKQKVFWAKTQFELNYQVIRSINTSQGVSTSNETFSFKGSYEFLQKSSGQDSAFLSPAQLGGTQNKAQPTQDALTELQKYFSPENTAARILDVATSFFSVSETGQTQGNTEAARRTFADFIGGAINEGFKQAQGLLGNLPEDVQAGVDKTHTLVFSGLENFVKNGVAPEKEAPGGVFEKIAAYRQEAHKQMELLKTASGATGYNANGDLQPTVSATSTISTKV